MSEGKDIVIVVITLLVALPLTILFFTVLFFPLAGLIGSIISIAAICFIYSYYEDKDAIVIEGIILLTITLISLFLIVFAPNNTLFTHKSSFQEGLGKFLLFLGYPLFRIARSIVSVIKQNMEDGVRNNSGGGQGWG